MNPREKETSDLIRGLAGGFLFGVPLFYTREVWWIGRYTNPGNLLITLSLSFAAVFILNITDGFRSVKGNIAAELVDSVKAMAIGLFCSALVLLLLGQITLYSVQNALYVVVLESIPFTIGVSIANEMMSGGRESFNKTEGKWKKVLLDAAATIIGALFVSFTLAPSREIRIIAGEIGPARLLAVLFFSLGLSYLIVFEASFPGNQGRLEFSNLLQKPLPETVVTYTLSLLVACILLIMFQQLTLKDPFHMWVAQVLVLGLAATVGGAAGRLAV